MMVDWKFSVVMATTEDIAEFINTIIPDKCSIVCNEHLRINTNDTLYVIKPQLLLKHIYENFHSKAFFTKSLLTWSNDPQV